MSIYFLTGASGAVGSAIVPLLLADPDTQVRLLLRADSDTTLEKRLNDLVQFWGLSNDPGQLMRLKAFRGDAALANFGLQDAQYNELTNECTHAIHCAGTVRMNLPLEDARHSAVNSAQEMVGFARKLAAAGHLIKFEYVSTLGVAGKRPGVLPECWLDKIPVFHNTYEQAKAEAEEIVHDAIANKGLPATVHRPSMVIGDSRDGRIIHFQIFYFICEFLSGRKTFGLFPNFGETRLDVIPVNWVADAIVASSRDTATAGKIFHLCSGPEQAPKLEELKAFVRNAFKDHGLSVPSGLSMPRSMFAALAQLASRLASESKRKSLSTLPIYLDYLADQQGFGNSAYTSWLKSRGLYLPDKKDYLHNVLNYYLKMHHHSQPAKRK
jgi:thioester reductase-like protein